MKSLQTTFNAGARAKNNIGWAEPLVLQILEKTGGAMSMAQIRASDPILRDESESAVTWLLTNMAGRGIIQKVEPIGGRERMTRYALPSKPEAAGSREFSWRDRPEWQPCRRMQAAIERCKGIRYLSFLKANKA